MVFSSSLRISMPVMFGYFPVAMTFGLVASQQGVSVSMALALSGLVFAGASQFVGLTMLATNDTGFLAVFFTVGLINLRHFILSLAYLPQVRSWTVFQKLRFFPFLTDETFAVLLGQPSVAARPGAAWSVALLNYGTWFAGTATGYFSGHLIPDPKKFGLDFALPALFIGIIVLFIKKKSHIIALLATLALTVLFFGVFDLGRNGVLFAAMLGGTIGWQFGRATERAP